MRHLAASLIVAGALGTGCGVGTVDRTYDDSLIRDVGTGSTALGKIIPTIQAQANLPGNFKDPRNDRAQTLLFQGQLAKLTEQDLVRLAKANRQGARRFATILAKLDGIESDVRTARVDASAHGNLSDGAKRFIAAWNDYLTANAERVHSLRQAFASMRPLFNEFESVLRAAYDTARLRSTASFERINKRVVADVVRRVSRLQRTVKAVAAEAPADRKFADLVNHKQEAQAIVKKVNGRYPHGSLADQFKSG